MHGQGAFWDPRLNDTNTFPLAAKKGYGNVRTTNDVITPKLAALHFYQLAIPSPKPPSTNFNAEASVRGEVLFNGKARCSACHVPPLFTEPGWNMHTASEIGIDDFQANRSPDKRYRTTPLNGLFTRSKGGFYHDGRFASLADVVNHYNGHLQLSLDVAEIADLVEYLNSL
jgi:cytochrome c peroxidase